MRIITGLVGGALAAAATGAIAQPMPQSHEQPKAAGQHQVADSKEKCCCEEMMRKMMTEMMQKHQGMGMDAPKGAQQSGMDPAH